MIRSATARRRQAEQRRAQFIDVALDVFAEKGLDGATVKDLAEAAGVAQGLLYHYFRSKEELLHAALERHYFLPQLRQITSPDQSRPAGEVLLEVAEGFAAILGEHRQLVRMMIREAPSNAEIGARLARARQEGVQLLAVYLDSRVAAGELRPHDTEAAARLLLYAVAMAHLADAPTDRFLPAAVETLLHGLLPQADRRPDASEQPAPGAQSAGSGRIPRSADNAKP
ncbi:MAG: TetR/AcrR family transcriptional regulator [Chloroflexota bacterium]